MCPPRAFFADTMAGLADQFTASHLTCVVSDVPTPAQPMIGQLRCGHSPHLERPREFRSLVTRFLA
jgi:hypothetical protein